MLLGCQLFHVSPVVLGATTYQLLVVEFGPAPQVNKYKIRSQIKFMHTTLYLYTSTKLKTC